MRYNDWQTRLAVYLRTIQDQPFTWGHHDCALFAANAVLHTTGQDPAPMFRGVYTDRAGAHAALKAFAGGGLAETAEKICAQCRFPEVLPAFCQRGDVALCTQGGHDTLGIIDFTGQYVMIAADKGITRKPLDCVKRVWRVE